MCQLDYGYKECLEEATTVYKVVQVREDGTYVSPVPVELREIQEWGMPIAGTVLHYVLGASICSPLVDTAGIYVFMTQELAEEYAKGFFHDLTYAVLECKVPESACVIYEIVQFSGRTPRKARVEELIPIKVVKTFRHSKIGGHNVPI